MKELIELTLLLDRYKVRQIHTLANSYGGNSLFDKFYNGLKAGEIASDEEAKNYLYQEGCSNGAYRKLKNRFRQRLLNTLFFVDTNKPQFSNCQTAYYNCYTELAQVHILLGRGCRLSAIELAEKVILQAMKYEFTEIVYSFARILRTHYGTVDGNKKKSVYYSNLCQQQLVVLHAEEEAEHYYALVLSDFVRSRAQKPEKLQQIKTAVATLSPYFKQVKTNNFVTRFYTLEVLLHETTGNLPMYMDACEKAIMILEGKSFKAKKLLFNFYTMLLMVYLRTSSYEKCKHVLAKNKSLVSISEINWFIHQNLSFIFLLHIEQYQEAYDQYVEVVKNEFFALQNEEQQENWQIYRAYLYFLQQIGKLEDREQIFKEFRLNSFLNNVPIFEKDKRGLNISILIAQFIILLKKKKYNRLIDINEGLKQYTTRYLRINSTHRSNCFIKMLTKISVGNFHPRLVRMKTSSYEKKMLLTPLNNNNLSREIEIIPYETLWKMVLDCL